jgi:hypothetical protein
MEVGMTKRERQQARDLEEYAGSSLVKEVHEIGDRIAEREEALKQAALEYAAMLVDECSSGKHGGLANASRYIRSKMTKPAVAVGLRGKELAGMVVTHHGVQFGLTDCDELGHRDLVIVGCFDDHPGHQHIQKVVHVEVALEDRRRLVRMLSRKDKRR